MKNFTSIKNIASILTLSIFVFSLISCSTSQNAYNNGDDGIYSSNSKKEIAIVKDTRSNYYENYFSLDGNQYDINQDQIFTDIDEYGYEDTDTTYVDNQYNSAAPPWNYATNVSVNYHTGYGGYSNPWYYNHYSPWNHYGDYSYGYGGYNPWYNGYGYGYNSWYGGYGSSWGRHYPYYSGYHNYYPSYRSSYYANSTYGKRHTTNRLNTRNYTNRAAYGYKRSSSSNTTNRRASTRQSSQRNNNNVITRRSNTQNSNSNNRSYNRRSDTRSSSPNYRSGSGSIRRSTGRHQASANTNNRTVYYARSGVRQNNIPVKMARTNQKRVSYSNSRYNTNRSTNNRTVNPRNNTRTRSTTQKNYNTRSTNNSGTYNRSSNTSRSTRSSSPSRSYTPSRSSSPSRSSGVSRSSSSSSRSSSRSSRR